MKATRAFLFGLGLFIVTGLAFADAPAKEEKTKICFQCNGTGKSKCTRCVGGQANCPAPCLKLTDGGWVHMNVAGHPPTDLWRTFRGKSGTMSWNQNHVGEIISIVNGEPTNLGKCPTCGGSTKVKCAVCKGTGEVTCTLCESKKVVPESWSAFDNPKLKSRPTHFKLEDGRVIVGRKTMIVGSTVTIKTEKDSVKIQATDILSEETPSSRK